MEFIGRCESDGLKMGAYKNEAGQVEVIFDTIDRSYRAGILHVTHEINLAYTEWFEYDEQEASEKAEALGLPPIVSKCAAALGIAV